MRRCIFIILDGVGVGALPDADAYGDAGSDTLGNLSRVVDLHLPNLQRLGLGTIAPIQGVPPVRIPECLPGRLAPQSVGKDTTVGHWEHMGLVTDKPFPTYPDGFPEEILAPFQAAIGRAVLGNRPASGTEIIAELGEEHLATGKPIVYTSADSVFQIAAHEDAVPLQQLYSWCETARSLLTGPHAVARVIARPFAGQPGHFVRTKDRRDFSVEPPGPTYLDILQGQGVPVIALGKISEIFAGKGVSARINVASNEENLQVLSALLRNKSALASFDEGLLLTNLVDFDTKWGHRNDVEGFGHGLEVVDKLLPELLSALRAGDLLLITADHGVDPTTPSTDHSREYVPLLLYPRPLGAPLSVYESSFSDTGATAYRYLTGSKPSLAGNVISGLQPSRGWRRFTPILHVVGAERETIPVRVGADEAKQAAQYLAAVLGPAPDVAVVLGSGLTLAGSLACDSSEATSPGVSATESHRSPGDPGRNPGDSGRNPGDSGRNPGDTGPPPGERRCISYRSIPYWRTGSVTGHPHTMALLHWGALRLALLQGRVHEYEGYDLGEVQLPIRTLASWGTTKLILTTSSGSVTASFAPGQVLMVREVLDFQYLGAEGRPMRLPATDNELLGVLRRDGFTHASVNGPQYETPAELAMLRSLGASTVSMSPAGELRAALEEEMNVAVLAVVTNVGETTHEAVLAHGEAAADSLTRAIEAVLRFWEGR